VYTADGQRSMRRRLMRMSASRRPRARPPVKLKAVKTSVFLAPSVSTPGNMSRMIRAFRNSSRNPSTAASFARGTDYEPAPPRYLRRISSRLPLAANSSSSALMSSRRRVLPFLTTKPSCSASLASRAETAVSPLVWAW